MCVECVYINLIKSSRITKEEEGYDVLWVDAVCGGGGRPPPETHMATKTSTTRDSIVRLGNYANVPVSYLYLIKTSMHDEGRRGRSKRRRRNPTHNIPPHPTFPWPLHFAIYLFHLSIYTHNFPQ